MSALKSALFPIVNQLNHGLLILYSRIYTINMSALKSALTLAYYQDLSNNILQELSLKIHANIIYRLSKWLYLITYKLLNWGCRGGRVRKRRGETPRVGLKENQPIRADFPDARLIASINIIRSVYCYF